MRFVKLAMSASVVILPALAGCATHSATGSMAPRCTVVGCVEPLDLADAGVGSTVLLVHCVGTTQTLRRYQLETDGWTLLMYETHDSGDCHASSPAR